MLQWRTGGKSRLRGCHLDGNVSKFSNDVLPKDICLSPPAFKGRSLPFYAPLRDLSKRKRAVRGLSRDTL